MLVSYFLGTLQEIHEHLLAHYAPVVEVFLQRKILLNYNVHVFKL